ncbi:MAG: Gfo/Idh/MocA family oxidoreductase [Bifidobacteriaceae bacterium]|nr:Gfo/Idh/MocA family oxidoreductase [Bifidobacteriaceae bacterium]
MTRIAVVGLGKMGLSHLSIARAIDGVDVVGLCDSASYLRSVIGKYTGTETFGDYSKMLDRQAPDGVIVATPTRLHAPMVREALERGIAVFCEKPFCLTAAQSTEMVALAEAHGLVTQVGYHNRFVGTFAEVKRLLDLRAIGDVTHGLAEAYGPVVLKHQHGTWRSSKNEGGGALYDYAAHPLNLINWYLGRPDGVGGTVLHSVFSDETDDEVSSTMLFPDRATVQLSVNWSDESVRKMTTRISLWGTSGRITADRQEIRVYLRGGAELPEGYVRGWNVRDTTELTPPVQFYLRGEEYSAQLEQFAANVEVGRLGGTNDMASALVTDQCIELLMEDNRRAGFFGLTDSPMPLEPKARRSWYRPGRSHGRGENG